jgi:MFS family permease
MSFLTTASGQVVMTLSSIQTASNGIPDLVIGRVIAGLCVGIASAIVPVYQSEIAPKEIRGRVASLQQWAITWGILIQYVDRAYIISTTHTCTR